MKVNFSGDFDTDDSRKIVIQSESDDRSTDEVIQSIKYLNHNVVIEIFFNLS